MISMFASTIQREAQVSISANQSLTPDLNGELPVRDKGDDMALLKFKKLLEDLETGSKQVFTGTVKTASGATLATSAGVAGSADYAGTSSKATTSGVSGSAAYAGTSYLTTSAGVAGSAAFSGTAMLATSSGEAGSAAYAGTAYTIPSIHGGAGTHAY